MRKALLILLVPLVLVLAACGGKTTGASNVTATSATLTGTGQCDSGATCTAWARYRRQGSSTWTSTPAQTFTGTRTLTANVTGLSPLTTYEWEGCGTQNGSSTVCYDSTGTANGTAYSKFTTHAANVMLRLDPADHSKVQVTAMPDRTATLHIAVMQDTNATGIQYLDVSAPSSLPWDYQPPPDKPVVDMLARDASGNDLGTWYSSYPGGSRIVTTPPGSHLYGVENAIGWGATNTARTALHVGGERECQDNVSSTTLQNGLTALAANGEKLTLCVNDYTGLSTLSSTTYSNEVTSAVNAYGPGGSFWTGKSQTAPVIHYELMNEPYGPWYRGGDNSPSGYARLVKAAAQAGHAACSTCKFYVALWGNDGTTQMNWNRALLSAIPDLFTYVDGFVIHEYDTPINVATQVDGIKNWAWPQTGGNGKPFIITELNLDNNTPSPEQSYVDAMPQFVSMVSSRAWLTQIFIFNWHCYSSGNAGEQMLGFVDCNGNNRQARMDAYKNAIINAGG